MLSFLNRYRQNYEEFIPKAFLCFKEGYTIHKFYKDLFAGIGIGIIAIPLALAFAIASGVAPEQGLYTAIVAGFLISLLGGSRVQIGGPTGAFVVLVFSIVSRFGSAGLALATLIAAFLLILMGLARLGNLLKFIPQPVIIGFTTGIAFVIFTSQIKDFFGLATPSLPAECLGKWKIFGHCFSTWQAIPFGVGAFTLVSLFLLKRYLPRMPGAMIAILFATLASQIFQLPLETIGSRFGEIPRHLPMPSLPAFSIDLFLAVFPSSLTVALLGSLESLLSASIADGATGRRHRSNIELIGQGIANIGSVLFGGIPATGAIARTRANIQLGAQTPVAGMIHALTILISMLFLAPYVSLIPLAALSGVLIYVAWNMSELPHFIEIIKGPKGEAFLLILTSILTILFDLTIAIQVGTLLSALIFLKRMTDKTTVAFSHQSSGEIAVLDWNGPLFYTVCHLLDEALQKMTPSQKVCVLNLNKATIVDATGQKALSRFETKCKEKQMLLLIIGHSSQFLRSKAHPRFFTSFDEAIDYATTKSKLRPS